MFSQIAFDEDLWTDRQVKDCVRHQRDSVDVSNPSGLNTSNDGTRHESVDVAIGKDDET